VIISALKSKETTDTRSPIHLETISSILSLETSIIFEEGIGAGIYTDDNAFEKLGLNAASRNDCLSKANLIITLQSFIK
jgi:NAD/NADP transhydrogenase alpha subunit